MKIEKNHLGLDVFVFSIIVTGSWVSSLIVEFITDTDKTMEHNHSHLPSLRRLVGMALVSGTRIAWVRVPPG